MALYNFHRVLITLSILFDFGFTLWCIRFYNRQPQSVRETWSFLDNPLVWGALSTVVVIVMVAYLIHFNRNLSNLRAMLSEPLRCGQCGYDLRGSMGGTIDSCPECGAVISDDLRRRAATV